MGGPFYVRRMFHTNIDGPFKTLREAVRHIKRALGKDSFWDCDGVAIYRTDPFNREPIARRWWTRAV